MSQSEDIGLTKKVKRTYRFDGYIIRDQEPFVNVFREENYISSTTNEVLAEIRKYDFIIKWSDLAGQSWTLSDGSTITSEHIYEALALIFDQKDGVL